MVDALSDNHLAVIAKAILFPNISIIYLELVLRDLPSSFSRSLMEKMDKVV